MTPSERARRDLALCDLRQRLIAALAGACLEAYRAAPEEERESVFSAFLEAQTALEAWLPE
ncbi:hypothetical protein [Xylanimonas ulmi]|nr:hypothetical protein [Xylanibacterium ulmi]